MGIRGYVQVKAPKYGKHCLSSWVANQCVALMSDNGVTVYEHNGDNDQWEIEVDDTLRAFVKKLRNNTSMLDKYLSGELKGSYHGEALLSLLDEGLMAAANENMTFITIDWY